MRVRDGIRTRRHAGSGVSAPPEIRRCRPRSSESPVKTRGPAGCSTRARARHRSRDRRRRMRPLKDAEHLFRLAALFAAGLFVFGIARAELVPASFGTLGHYRANAIDDIRARPVAYAGQA